ncbi:hypothetical protein Tco_0877084 [Tanacetum coccineum]|uniref:Uncharacterized protein n=1 Tax=Tanacetum coccineum TaxID=301880 RepID=A0ABQ5BXJ9_9ASTR
MARAEILHLDDLSRNYLLTDYPLLAQAGYCLVPHTTAHIERCTILLWSLHTDRSESHTQTFCRTRQRRSIGFTRREGEERVFAYAHLVTQITRTRGYTTVLQRASTIRIAAQLALHRYRDTEISQSQARHIKSTVEVHTVTPGQRWGICSSLSVSTWIDSHREGRSIDDRGSIFADSRDIVLVEGGDINRAVDINPATAEIQRLDLSDALQHTNVRSLSNERDTLCYTELMSISPRRVSSLVELTELDKL